MIQQTKKLRLDELQVDSFVTSASSSVVTIKGGSYTDNERDCHSIPYDACATYDPVAWSDCCPPESVAGRDCPTGDRSWCGYGSYFTCITSPDICD